MIFIASLYFVASILSILILLYLLYRILRGLYVWSSANALFGGDAKTSLLSLGLAVIPFSTVLPTIIKIIVKFIVDILRFVPNELYSKWQEQYAAFQQTGVHAKSLADLGFGFLFAWGHGITQAYDGVVNFPYFSLTLMLALWVLFAYMLSQPPAVTGLVRGRIWLQTAYSRLSPSAVRNMLFFLILGVGAYLSLAAITAIPSLQEATTEADETSINKLKTELENIEAQFEKKADKDIADTNPFYSLDLRLEEASAQSGNSDGASADNQLTSLKSSAAQSDTTNAVAGNPAQPTDAALKEQKLKKYRDLVMEKLSEEHIKREQLINKYKSLISQAVSELQLALNQGITQYSGNEVGRRGVRERIKHSLAINNWFDQKTGYLYKNLSDCSSHITSMDVIWEAWARKLRADLVTENIKDEIKNTNQDDDATLKICRLTTDDPKFNIAFPIRDPLGSDLGPFRYLVGWLLGTESPALALITGLFGFGLLGSACSTFVRERELKRQTDPLPQGVQTSAVIVEDLTGVVIRGVSAAIVVFLAVEGGLAIFASPNSQPNSYVLLLTCLVAAVFSEVIWKWAQNWITSNFSPDDGNRQEPEQDQQARDQVKEDEQGQDEEIEQDKKDEAVQDKSTEAKQDKLQIGETDLINTPFGTHGTEQTGKAQEEVKGNESLNTEQVSGEPRESDSTGSETQENNQGDDPSKSSG